MTNMQSNTGTFGSLVKLDWVQVDPVVMGVLLVLLALSLLTWFLIAYKTAELWRVKRANARYTRCFWQSSDLTALQSGAPLPTLQVPMAQLTQSGMTAVQRYRAIHHGPHHGGEDLVNTLTRALRQSIQDQVTHFEWGLGMLATIGNTAPFIGLFGTVVGIMSALKGIAGSGSADLNVVAGPIGEALVATAMGIACAIPAVVAYNSFLRRLKVLANGLDGFAYDLLARLTVEPPSISVGTSTKVEA